MLVLGGHEQIAGGSDFPHLVGGRGCGGRIAWCVGLVVVWCECCVWIYESVLDVMVDWALGLRCDGFNRCL